MSLNFKSLAMNGMKDILGSYIREHSGEVAIFAITGTILVGVAFLATGDIASALARHRH
jgi:succinate dehydrogenase hydrophobic anchor subunit